jgi:hypothetical protein
VDVDSDQDRQERRDRNEEDVPAQRGDLHRGDIRLELGDRGLEPVHQAVGAILDERDELLRLGVLLLNVGRVVLQDGGHDAIAEDVVELVGRDGHLVDPGPLVRVPGVPAHLLDHLYDVPICTSVAREMGIIAEDDGVRLVRILIPHGARQLEREPDPLLIALRLQEAVVDAPHVREHQVRRQGERRHQHREGDEEPAAGPEGCTHPARLR